MAAAGSSWWVRGRAGLVGGSAVVLAAALLPVLPVSAQAAPIAAMSAASPGSVAGRGEALRAAPDAAAALVAAQRQGSRVEVLEATSETSVTFAEPDGSFTTEVAARPVRTRDEDGSWRAVDTTLVQAADGSWAPRNALAEVSVSGGGSGAFTSLDPSGPGRVGLSWPGALPEPKVDGSTATFADVQPGVDLVVTALPSGFSELLVIKDRPIDPVQFELGLAVGQGNARVAGDGGVVVRAGREVVVSAPAALMWDANGSAPAEAASAAVETVIDTAEDGTQTLVLTPDPAVLADPGTVFPVTVDPTFTTVPSGDSWMQFPDYTTAQRGSPELRVGTSDGGAHVARSFLHFRNAEKAFLGAKINTATLSMTNFASASCTSAGVKVERITADWAGETMTWANQPSVTSADSTTFSTPFGGPSGACTAPGTASWGIGPLVQQWADGQPNYGLRVAAVSETNSNSWRQYRSVDYAVPAEQPWLTVNYNSYPATPEGLSWSPKSTYTAGSTTTGYSTKVTPWLSATVTDPDGGSVNARFSVSQGSTVLLDKVWGSQVLSGEVSTYHVPNGLLVHGGTYTVQVWGADQALSSKTPSSTSLTVDTTSPAAPSVSSATFAANAWTYGSSSGSFTFSDTSTDVVAYKYSFDAGTTWTTVPGAPAATTLSIAVPAGWNSMKVQAIDKAGRDGPSATYSFGANAAMTSPTDQQQTAQLVGLDAVGPSAATGVTFQWRLPGASTWTNIPVAHVINAGTGNPITSWPVNVKTGAVSQTKVPNFGMNWNVLSTRGNADGAVEVRAQFAGAGGPFNSVKATVTVDRKAIGGDNASMPVGPGNVSLLTGAFSTYAGEAGVFRTWNSNDTATTGLFGPGWTTSLPAGWVALSDQGSSVVVTSSDGSVVTFAKKSGGGYTGQADALAYTLTSTGSGSATVFRLADPDGAYATFGWNQTGTFVSSPTVAAPNGYRVVTFVAAGSRSSTGALTTRYAYNTTGIFVGLPKEVFEPPADGHNCATTWSAGCRSTQLTYTGSSAATARVSKVTTRAVDSAGATQTFDVGCYTYDASNRLVSAWDPRTMSATCSFGSPVLAMSYGYDASNRITSITPAGQAAWVVGYDGSGRVSAVSRTHNATFGSGTVSTGFAYGVPISANTTNPQFNPDVTNAARKTWAQTAVPATATAVFPPGTPVSSTDLRGASVHVLDLNGREINTAAYSGTGQAGWKITTSEYDAFGNLVRSLTAANRDLALALDPDTVDELGLPATATSDQLARAVDDRWIYAADGIDLLEAFGPTRVVALPDGSTAPARAYTKTSYGTVDMAAASPTLPADPTTGGPLHAAVKVETSASRSPDPVATSLTDTRTVKYAYGLSTTDTAGWYLGSPMRTTTVIPGGTDIVTETRMDPTTGQTLEVRQPSAGACQMVCVWS